VNRIPLFFSRLELGYYAIQDGCGPLEYISQEGAPSPTSLTRPAIVLPRGTPSDSSGRFPPETGKLRYEALERNRTGLKPSRPK